MSDALLRILAMIEDEKSVVISDSELRKAADYLGLGPGLAKFPNERWRVQIVSELHRQNAVLSKNTSPAEAELSDLYRTSAYVREMYGRSEKSKGSAKKMKPDRPASIKDVEKALVAVCEILDYPLYVANATCDERVIRFVADLAGDVFERVQVKFEELRRQIESD